ncbi:MAG: shufflon system plasmid conjugative transfer pilus tip adhesin PilV [Lachnospiraceae bacterium]|nr:shufflon system plasmid conjugative transfer pilus tip adhesin PilV [Lachnospiraceae bacterium]
MHILGSIGAVVIMLVMIPQLLSWWDTGNTNSQQSVIADHLLKVTDAAHNYMLANQATLMSTCTKTTGPAVLHVQDLIDGGYLESGFSTTNAWLQGYDVYFRKPSDNHLTAIVLTTGGRENNTDKFNNTVVPGAAALAGGAGGYIGTGNIAAQTTNHLVGSGSGYLLNLTEYGITSPGIGHVGSITSYSKSALGQDYLYRYSVPGMEELNAMQTNLDMTGHEIKNLGALQFRARDLTDSTCSEEDYGKIFFTNEKGLYICRNGQMEQIGDSGNSSQVGKATVVPSGTTIDKPNCNSSTTPAIYTAPATFAAGAEAPTITAVQTWAVDGSSSWQVFMRIQTTDDTISGSDSEGWVYPTADYGRILVLTMCQKND